MLYDFSGKTRYEGIDSVRPAEVNARDKAGGTRYPYDVPGLRPFWQNPIGRLIESLYISK